MKVVYDSVGKTTALGSLSLVRPLGTLVLYGQSSGVVPPIDPLALMRQGSIFLTRPTLFHYIAEAASLQQRRGAGVWPRQGWQPEAAGRPPVPARAGRAGAHGTRGPPHDGGKSC
ncbi:MAG: hypothetical protein WDM96_14860 [Lacunisphaera sp.]